METKSEQIIKMVSDILNGITNPSKKDLSDIIQICYNEQMEIDFSKQKDFNKSQLK